MLIWNTFSIRYYNVLYSRCITGYYYWCSIQSLITYANHPFNISSFLFLASLYSKSSPGIISLCPKTILGTFLWVVCWCISFQCLLLEKIVCLLSFYKKGFTKLGLLDCQWFYFSVLIFSVAAKKLAVNQTLLLCLLFSVISVLFV